MNNNNAPNNNDVEVALANAVCPPCAPAVPPVLPKSGTYNIAMCKELMVPLHDLMNTIFENGDKMDDALYKQLLEGVANLSKVPFYVVLEETSKKKAINRRKVEKVDNRKMIRMYPDKYVECARCGVVLKTKSLKAHLGSDVCKDTFYSKKASLISKKMKDNNDKIVELYDKNDPLPEYTEEQIEAMPGYDFWAHNA